MARGLGLGPLAAARPGVILSAGKLGHPTVLAVARGRRDRPRVYRMSNEIERGSAVRTWRRTLMARLVARDAAVVTFVGGTVAESPALLKVLADGRGEAGCARPCAAPLVGGAHTRGAGGGAAPRIEELAAADRRGGDRTARAAGAAGDPGRRRWRGSWGRSGCSPASAGRR